jgi:hypothetical protein
VKNFEGWQFRCARCASGWGYRELAEEADVATTTIMRLERWPVVRVSETGRKEKDKAAPDVVERLLAAFERAGFRLVPATAARPARVEHIE